MGGLSSTQQAQRNLSSCGSGSLPSSGLRVPVAEPALPCAIAPLLPDEGQSPPGSESPGHLNSKGPAPGDQQRLCDEGGAARESAPGALSVEASGACTRTRTRACTGTRQTSQPGGRAGWGAGAAGDGEGASVSALGFLQGTQLPVLSLSCHSPGPGAMRAQPRPHRGPGRLRGWDCQDRMETCLLWVEPWVQSKTTGG